MANSPTIDLVRHLRTACSGATRLRADDPAETTFDAELSHLHLYLGDLWAQRGDLDKAEGMIREALARQEGLSRKFPDNYDYRRTAAACQDKLARLLVLRGQGAAAERLYREHVETLERLARDFPSPSWPKEMLGLCLAACPVATARDGARALTVAEVMKRTGMDAKAHSRIVGIARYRMGDWQECITALVRCLPEDGPGAVEVAYYLAMSCHQAGRLEEATKYLELAREWGRKPGQWYEFRGVLRAEAEALLSGSGTWGR
jgi:tetratricopeptide (TPR) repeat protein